VRVILLVILWQISFSVASDEVRWEYDSKRIADIDCDGYPDEIIIGYLKSKFQIKVIPSSTKIPSIITFGLGDPMQQDGLCGLEVELTFYPSDSDAIEEEFGEVFEGYKSGPNCLDINLSAGDCDSIHVFWNHDTKHINWWRR
jgi:hypothetical protein